MVTIKFTIDASLLCIHLRIIDELFIRILKSNWNISLYILSLKKDLWVYNADCGVGKASKYNKDKRAESV